MNKVIRNLRSTSISMLMILTMLVSFLVPVLAEGSPPTTLGVPKNFAIANYGGAALVCTMSASDDLRAIIGKTKTELGYTFKLMAQTDFKTNDGNYRYNAAWDDPATVEKYTMGFSLGGDDLMYLAGNRLTFKTMFPGDTDTPVAAAFNSWDWFKTNKVTAKARFVLYIYETKSYIFSDWTSEYVLTDSVKMDYNKILADNGPTLKSSRIEVLGVTKVPWVVIDMEQHPNDIQKFNAAASNGMWTEVWVRKLGEKDFTNVGQVAFSHERIWLNVSAYFKDKLDSYEAQSYEVKVRYTIDERNYAQSNQTKMTMLTSKYSNVLAYNMPAWSAASPWAQTYLADAEESGLIPDILQGADMTKPITRKEFAALAVKLYEAMSGKVAVAAAVNPFSDTSDLEILKAYNLGVTNGVEAGKFAPNDLITREQCAAMLTRCYKLTFWEGWTLATDGSYSAHTLDYTGVSTFADDAKISGYAKPSVYFMVKNNIIGGVGNNIFAPNTSGIAANAALNYGRATREVAIKIAVESYKNLKN